MKVELTKASSWDYKETITINSLEGLVNFLKDVGQDLILSLDDEENLRIKIYDDYVE